MTAKWRLVDSGTVPPPESAALDEAMLEWHSRGHVPDTLHFYIRSRPTVSVGYFQRVAESVDLDECSERGVEVVRRRSGGRSIYTDSGQLIYAVVADAASVAGRGGDSFVPVCSALARALCALGVDAVHRPVNDIEVGGRKVSGSAQLRRRGSVLQHGTVIVDTDTDTMDAVLRHGVARPSERVTTLAELLPDAGIDIASVKRSLEAEVARAFDAAFERMPLTGEERGTVDELVASRYSLREWNLRY